MESPPGLGYRDAGKAPRPGTARDAQHQGDGFASPSFGGKVNRRRRSSKASLTPPSIPSPSSATGAPKGSSSSTGAPKGSSSSSSTEGEPPRKLRYLARHLDTLKPFLQHREIQKLRDAATMEGEDEEDGGDAKNTEEVSKQPAYLTGELKDYQQEGVAWLAKQFDRRMNCILADEMGLGKTIQTIAFFAHAKFEKKATGRFLVICPLSVLPGWMYELRKWCPQLRALRVHTHSQEERQRLCRLVEKGEDYDVCVTTYDTLKDESCKRVLIHKTQWCSVFFDEGHVLRNEESQLGMLARKFRADFMVLLTGTPVQNSLHEVWALLQHLHHDTFPSSEVFDRSFQIGRGKAIVDAAMVGKTHALMKIFSLRRTKAEVEMSVPPYLETVITCPLSPLQLESYKRLLHDEKEAILRCGTENSQPDWADWRRLQILWLQLRKCCNHPYLLPGAEPEGVDVQRLIGASGKLQVLDRLLNKLHGAGHRCLIFSQFKQTLDVLDDYCYLRGFQYTRLDGSTNRTQRWLQVALFNEAGSELTILLMTTRAGGLGINVQSADTVILYDSDWNPHGDAQAIARAHRIGQTKVVHVYRLMCGGTVEERVQQHAEKKLYLHQMVNRDGQQGTGEDEDVDDENQPQHGSLVTSLAFGADRVFKGVAGTGPTDDELSFMIDRTRRPDDVGGALKFEKKALESYDPASGYRAIRDLLGTTYERQTQPTAETPSTTESGVRKRKQRLVELPDGAGGSASVLTANMYTMAEGERSVFDQELKGRSSRGGGSKGRAAGGEAAAEEDAYEHSDYCQACWDGGSLICCDLCPAAYHASCLGLSSKEEGMVAKQRWCCPQHKCATCTLGAGAAGGALLQCTVCPKAYCQDDLPADFKLVGENGYFAKLGFQMGRHMYYVHCSQACADRAAEVEVEERELAGLLTRRAHKKKLKTG